MADQKQNDANRQSSQSISREPRGFTPKAGGLTSEYAREQGWDLNQAERMKTATEKQEYDGGRDYEYGAEDFGDTAVDTSSATPEKLGVDPERLRQRASRSDASPSGDRRGEGSDGMPRGPEVDDL